MCEKVFRQEGKRVVSREIERLQDTITGVWKRSDSFSNKDEDLYRQRTAIPP